MNVTDIARELKLENLTPELADKGSREVTGGYASDLLSDVLAHAPRGGVLVTVQVHLNVIAVAAVHTELSCVIFALDRRPDETTRRKAIEEGIPLYVSDESTFDLVGRLYALGVRGKHE